MVEVSGMHVSSHWEAAPLQRELPLEVVNFLALGCLSSVRELLIGLVDRGGVDQMTSEVISLSLCSSFWNTGWSVVL